jgi:hypothetical protein
MSLFDNRKNNEDIFVLIDNEKNKRLTIPLSCVDRMIQIESGDHNNKLELQLITGDFVTVLGDQKLKETLQQKLELPKTGNEFAQCYRTLKMMSLMRKNISWGNSDK